MSHGTSGFGTEKLIRLAGAIPTCPVILCRDDDAAIILKGNLRTYIGNIPTIMVVDDWPDIEEVAVIVTPLHILGSDVVESFPLNYELSDTAEKVLREIIRHKLASDGEIPTLREIGAAIDITTRAVTVALKEIEEAGLLYRTGDCGAYRTKMGKWRPDETLAKLADLA